MRWFIATWFRLAVLVLSAALCIGGAWAQSNSKPDYAVLAGEAWKRNDTRTAIELREKAYEAVPNGSNLFWLAYSLQQAGRSPEILGLMQRVPHEHWYPNGHDTETHRIFAMALVQNQEQEKALPIIFEAITKNDARQERNYELLVQRANGLAFVFANHPEFQTRYATLVEYVKNQGVKLAKSGLARVFYEFSLHRMNLQLRAGDFHDARLHIQLAKSLVPLQSDPLTEGYNADLYERALEFKAQQLTGPQVHVVTMKWLALFISGIDADITPRQGIVYRRKNTMSDAQIREYIRINQEESALAQLAFEYMSRGRLSFQFDYRKVDATITSSSDWIHSVVPTVGSIHAETIDQYDGYMYFYDKMIDDGSFYGGSRHPVLLPYVWMANQSRPFTHLNLRADYSLQIHELFHSLEGFYGIRGHGYALERQSEWLAPYRAVYQRLGIENGPAYYESVLQGIMAVQGFERLITHRTRPENLSAAVYQRVANTFAGTSLEQAKAARNFYTEAVVLEREKRYPEAQSRYQKAISVVPCYPDAYAALAWLQLRQFFGGKELEATLRNYLLRYAGINQNNDTRFLDQLLQGYLAQGKPGAVLDWIAGFSTDGVSAGVRTVLDYYQDRALEKLGRSEEVIKPSLDDQGCLIRASGEFDGIANYLEIGARSYISGTEAFTIIAQVHSLPGAGKQMIISQRSLQGFNGEYLLYVNAEGRLEFMVYGNGRTAFKITAPLALQDGKEHTIVAIRTAAGAGMLYMDKVLVAQAAGTPVALIPLPVYVGADRLDMNSYFKGRITGLQVFKRELSTVEIAAWEPFAVPSQP